jgi:ubiquitin fusion degradation protein 1
VIAKGKFFFGYKYIPFDAEGEEKKKKAKEAPAAAAPPASFQGEGNSLRRGGAQQSAPAKRAASAEEEEEKKVDPWANLGSGNTLSGRKRAAPAAPTPPVREPTRQEVIDATMLDEDDFMFGEEYSDNDDDDIIEIDSD